MAVKKAKKAPKTIDSVIQARVKSWLKDQDQFLVNDITSYLQDELGELIYQEIHSKVTAAIAAARA